MDFTNSMMSIRLQSLTASTTSFGLILLVAIRCSSLRGLRAALQLVPVGLEHADHLLQRRLDDPHELRGRALDRAQQLSQQHLARREVGRLPGLVRAHDPALDQAADDLEADPGLTGELAEHLRRGAQVAVAERDRDGTLQQVLEPLVSGVDRGPPRQRVLDDAVLYVLRAQPPAQVLELGDRQTPVVGEDGHLRPLQFLREQLDLLYLFLSWHKKTSAPADGHGGHTASLRYTSAGY